MTIILIQKLTEHLDLIEGVVVDLLQTKWKSFIKKRSDIKRIGRSTE